MGMGKSAWRCKKDGLRAKARNSVQLFLTQHPGPGAQPTRRVRTEHGLLRRQPGQLLLGTYKERCLDFKHFFYLWNVSAPLFHCRALKYQVLNTKGHGDVRLMEKPVFTGHSCMQSAEDKKGWRRALKMQEKEQNHWVAVPKRSNIHTVHLMKQEFCGNK